MTELPWHCQKSQFSCTYFSSLLFCLPSFQPLMSQEVMNRKGRAYLSLLNKREKVALLIRNHLLCFPHSYPYSSSGKLILNIYHIFSSLQTTVRWGQKESSKHSAFCFTSQPPLLSLSCAGQLQKSGNWGTESSGVMVQWK